MNISLIVAMAKNRVIGLNQQMPWHLPADLQHFRHITLNKTIIMGRKTYQSIGRPLPQRRNIVITKQQTLPEKQLELYHSLPAALQAVRDQEEIMIIGGQLVFTAAMPLAKRMYITHIDLSVNGDTFFPAWNPQEWQLTSEEHHHKDHNNPYDYRFTEYTRCDTETG